MCGPRRDGSGGTGAQGQGRDERESRDRTAASRCGGHWESLWRWIQTGVRTNPQPSERRAALFRGFADRDRVLTVEQLIGGEQRVTHIVRPTGRAQPDVSAHLSCLWDRVRTPRA